MSTFYISDKSTKLILEDLQGVLPCRVLDSSHPLKMFIFSQQSLNKPGEVLLSFQTAPQQSHWCAVKKNEIAFKCITSLCIYDLK